MSFAVLSSATGESIMKKTPFVQSASHARSLSVTAAWIMLAMTCGLTGQTAQAGTPDHDTPSAVSLQAGTPVISDWQKRTPFAATTIQTVQTMQTTPASRAASRKTARRKTARKASPAVIRAAMETSGTTPVSYDIFRDDTACLQSPTENTLPRIRTNETENPANAGYATPMQKGYAIGPARFSVNYEKANDKSLERASQLLSGKATYDIAANDLVETATERDNWRLGMEYDTGNGRVNAAMNLVRLRDQKSGKPSGDDAEPADLRTFTIGYTYDASETTSFYGMVAHTEYDSDALHGYRRGDTENDSITGFQVGVTHRF